MKEQALTTLFNNAKICKLCSLHENRINCVFHRGSPYSELVFVGEAGGRTENETGEPFVGRSGKLLDNMIKAMGFNRDDVYITNICRCSPPNNRKPTPQEMDACKPFLIKQLDIVKPKVIVALGATAIEGLCGKGYGVLKRRGKWEKYNNIPVLPTIHPAGCLRNPEWKKLVWQDLRNVLKFLGKIDS